MISASGQGTVAQLSLQLGALTGPLLGLPALSALSDTDSIDLDVVRADFTPVSFQLQPTIYAAQSASVQPLSRLTYTLGLGGSASDTSPMNEALPIGTARRVMTAPDLNIPERIKCTRHIATLLAPV
jgi:hypothetical protein